MDKDWIKLHRQLLDWQWYGDVNTTRLFIHLLLITNDKDKEWRGITVKAGGVAITQARLSSEIGLTRQQIRTALNNLQSTNDITIDKPAQHVIIYVENWNTYQEPTKEQPIVKQAKPKRAPQKMLSTDGDLLTPDSTRPVWAAYAEAYQARYGAEPVRNAKVNKCIKNFCTLVPMNEAPAIAAAYVWSNNQYYVSRGHKVETMVADAEKLCTEWRTGRAVTATQARQADELQSNVNVMNEVKEFFKGKADERTID